MTTTRLQLEATLAQRREERRKLENQYIKAKEEVNSETGRARTLLIQRELLEIISNFNIGDSGDKAIALLAVAKHLVKQLRDQYSVIEEYERQTKVITELQEKAEQ